MKKLFFLVAIPLFLFAKTKDDSPIFTLNEIAIGSGYAEGSLRGQNENYEVIPIFIHLGFELNRAWGFPNHPGKLYFVLEPFYNPIIAPKNSQEVGFDVFFQYAFPIIKDRIFPYVEIGAGPMYLGLRTVAQGSPGFNFLDQVGAGVKFYITDQYSLNLGYRYRHISHAGIRGKPNKGIDTNAGILSFSYYL